MKPPKILMDALNVVVNMTRCIALKRALTTIDPDPALNFWRTQYGCLLDMAVLEWCKLFGSDDKEYQQVHWKNIFSDEDGFRAGLFSSLKIKQEDWAAYWTEMKNYRDQHVAHLDFNRRDVNHYPKLDHALSSAAYYYSRLIHDLRKQGESSFPDDLAAFYDKFKVEAQQIAQAAIEGTRSFKESA